MPGPGDSTGYLNCAPLDHSRRPGPAYHPDMPEREQWRVAQLDDVERVHWRESDLIWLPLRDALDTRIVGMAAYTAERAGQEVVEDHVEDVDGRGHHEVYAVLAGRATFTLDGETLDAPVGTFIAVPPSVRRRAGRGRAGHSRAGAWRAADVRPVGFGMDRARPAAPAIRPGAGPGGVG